MEIGNSKVNANEFGGVKSNFKSFLVISFIMFFVISWSRPEFILT